MKKNLLLLIGIFCLSNILQLNAGTESQSSQNTKNNLCLTIMTLDSLIKPESQDGQPKMRRQVSFGSTTSTSSSMSITDCGTPALSPSKPTTSKNKLADRFGSFENFGVFYNDEAKRESHPTPDLSKNCPTPDLGSTPKN
ncbi:MAG: hypothetical protein JO129_00100 [Candidatus Dependentiae bacterium]|nr:hypothetical protein [Candidatus Dependentiae bacterium]